MEGNLYLEKNWESKCTYCVQDMEIAYEIILKFNVYKIPASLNLPQIGVLFLWDIFTNSESFTSSNRRKLYYKMVIVTPKNIL